MWRSTALTTFTADAVAALGGPAWLQERRRQALDRFEAASLPTASLEDWRYGRIDELDLDRFTPWTPPPSGTGEPGGAGLPAWLERLLASTGAAAVVAVCNGGPAALRVSTPAVRVEQVGATPRRTAPGQPDRLPAKTGAEVLEPLDGAPTAGRGAGPSDDAFRALSDAFSLPLVVRVGAGARPDGPVVVVHWCDAEGAATFPRTRVVVGPGAEVSVLEVAASGDVGALTIPVTELDVGDAAVVRYLHLQRLGPRAWQLGTQASRVGRDATLTSSLVALGGDYGRLRADSALVGPGATTRLLAAYFATASRVVDFRTTQDHRAPRTTSDLLFKGAVANRSQAVYSGLIRVEKGARGTDAFQTNRNLVLHEGARADSVPNLEIEDNDVRCSHASAVGPIAGDQRFYLESRGIPPETADRLIALGFLDEVLARMPFPPVVDHVRLELAAMLDAAQAAEGAAPGAASGAS